VSERAAPRSPRADDPVVADLLARTTFPGPGTQVTCAVSGGADSCALLALAVAAGLRVTAVHVDHGLRPGSEHEAAPVARLAAAWGAEFRAETVQVADGGDLEARARAARRAVLPPDTLHGHTADDQAETVLIRLLRGTGPAGLAAMDTATHPLLALRRAETVGLCAHLGVVPFEDPTNAATRFVRNRVRHEVLPLLDDVAGRDVVPLLCRLAELAADDAEAIRAQAAPIDPTDVVALRAVPRSVAAAALRSWWLERTGVEHPPDRAATDRALDVVAGRSVSCDLTHGWRLSRTAGRLRLDAPEPGDAAMVDRRDQRGNVGPR
jgi:tRNA(Ile)-lysidine synthase